MASNDTTRQVLFFIIIIIICFYSLSYSSLNICCIFLFLYKLLQQSALKKSFHRHGYLMKDASIVFVCHMKSTAEWSNSDLSYRKQRDREAEMQCIDHQICEKTWFGLELLVRFFLFLFVLFFFFTLKPLPQSCNKPWPGSDIYYLLLFRQVTKVACCACTDLITVLEVFKIQSLLNNGCCSALFKHIHSPLRLTQEQVNPYHKGTSFCVIQQFSNPNHNSCRARQVWAAKSRF